MAGLDRRIDPVTKDYVVDAKRSTWETTATCETAAYHQLQGFFGEWAGDSESGCRSHRIRRKASRATMMRMKDAFEECLQVLIDIGRARDLNVAIERDQHDAFIIATELTDSNAGRLDISNLLPFGA